jgi:V/A-type H+-transporting ATPase subunit E
MSLEKILKRIDTEFSRQRDRTRNESQAEVNKISKEARSKAASLKEEILRSASLEAKRRREHILTQAHLEARQVVLEEKERLIEETYSKTLAKLKKLGKKPYQELIKKMLSKVIQSELDHSSRSSSGPEAEIIIAREDRERITPSFLNSISKNLKISKEDRGINGGFILKRGKVEINDSFESLLRSRRDALEPGLVRRLFGK